MDACFRDVIDGQPQQRDSETSIDVMRTCRMIGGSDIFFAAHRY